MFARKCHLIFFNKKSCVKFLDLRQMFVSLHHQSLLNLIKQKEITLTNTKNGPRRDVSACFFLSTPHPSTLNIQHYKKTCLQ